MSSLRNMMARGIGALTRRVFGLELDDVLALGCPIVRRAETQAPFVALSFDDGPSTYGTPEVLEILRRYDVTATFFVIGENVLRHRALARRIQSDGHELGSHGNAHLDFHWLSPLAMRRDLKRSQEALRSATGTDARLFRAPYGHFRTDLTWWSRPAGFQHLVGWDVSPAWNETSGERLAAYVLERARQGSIIALHDGYDRHPSDERGYVAATRTALPILLDGLKERGLVPVTVSTLLGSAIG